MLRTLFCLLAVCTGCITLHAQKLTDFISYDTLTYVYVLDSTQTRFVFTHPDLPDTSFLFNTKPLTFSSRTYRDDSLGNGNFLVTTILQDRIYYRFVHHASFVLKTRCIGEDLIFYLSDTKTKALLTKASLQLNNQPVPFDDGYGGYAVSRKLFLKKKQTEFGATLCIVSGNEFQLERIQTSSTMPSVPEPRRYPAGTVLLSNGYVVTDKPVYRPGDTMRLKAFLYKGRKGKPLRRSVSLELNEPAQGFQLKRTLKAVSPGAFTWEWKIPDTLKIDRYMELTLRFDDQDMIYEKHARFYLENYQLNANQYNLELKSPEFYAGEDIAFNVRAEDASHFPLPGTLLHAKLRLEQVRDFLGDSLTLHSAQRHCWYEQDTVYPYTSNLLWHIPSSVLPAMDARYSVEVSFTDPSTFERKVLNVSFDKLMRTEKVHIYQQEDSFYVRCLYNTLDTARPFRVIAMSLQDTLSNRLIKTPYVFQLTPYTTRVICIGPDSTVYNTDIQFSKLGITHEHTDRTADSLHLSIRFPFNEEVYYHIFKGTQLIQKGKARQLDVQLRDESPDAYTLLLTTNLNNQIENNFYRIVVTPRVHQILLQHSLPADAFPGQTIPLDIRATDYKGHPLAQINITAFGINRQFEERRTTPEITVPPAYRDQILVEAPAQMHYISLLPMTCYLNRVLQPQQITRYALRRNEYYALRYPEKTYSLLSKKIQSSKPEFCVVLTNKHQIYSPKYILLDQQPVYISDIRNDIYSFQAKAGLHEISFRYFNKRITLHQVSFEAGRKYWIGVNADSLKKTDASWTVLDSMTTAQPDSTEKSMLYESLLLLNRFGFDTLQITRPGDSLPLFTYTNYRVPQTLNVDGDVFYVIGPLPASSDVKVRVFKRNYTLHVSSEYAHFYDAGTQGFSSKHLGAVKGIIFSFYENTLQDAQLNALYQPDTLPPAHARADVTYHPEPKKEQQEIADPVYPQQYQPAGNTEGQIQFHIRNNEKQDYIKALWIIRRDKTEASCFLSSVNRGNDFTFFLQANKAIYDIYVLLNHNRMVMFPSVSMQADDAIYMNPFRFHPDTITPARLAAPLKIYANLTQTPLLPFYDMPEQAKDTLREIPAAGKRQRPYLKGLLTVSNYEALPNAMILAEVNGEYRSGATTNAKGEFEFLDLQPGTYQLKIYHPDYRLKVLKPCFLQAGKSYELLSTLQHRDGQRPLLETIQNEFRFLAFPVATAEEEQFRIETYDKETRDILPHARVQILEQDQVVFEEGMESSNACHAAFPVFPDRIYTLKIIREGYLPVLYHQLQFMQGVRYHWQIFMTPLADSLGMRLKEYDLHLQNFQWKTDAPDFSTAAQEGHWQLIPDKKHDHEILLGAQFRNTKHTSLPPIQIALIRNGWIVQTLYTDPKGSCLLPVHADGLYDVRISAAGYLTVWIHDMELRTGSVTQLEYTLQENPEWTTQEGPDAASLVAPPSVVEPAPAETFNYYKDQKVMASPATVQVSGARRSATQYSIENISANASMPSYAATDIESSLQLTTALEKEKTRYASDADLLEVMNNPALSHTRSYFNDVAYWQPNLLTDKKGMVHASIHLPDNLTTWQSCLLAMGPHFLHGIDSAATAVYKPIQTQSILPLFLWDQDAVYARVRYSNLTATPKQVHTYIQVNQEGLYQADTLLAHDCNDSLLLKGAGLNKLIWKAGLTFAGTYKDEEEKEIPVYNSAFHFYTNRALFMEKDSTYSLEMTPGTKGYLILNNSLYEKILSYIKSLSQYEYGCVEQTASKLKALLYKERINQSLELKENLKPDIYGLLNRLAHDQHDDGTWGWWKTGERNWRITIYATDVLLQAIQQGYLNNTFEAGRSAILTNINQLSMADKLYAWYVLQKQHAIGTEISKTLDTMKAENLQPLDQVYYYKLQEGLGKATDPAVLYTLLLRMNKRLTEAYQEDFFFDPKADMFTAYTLFAQTAQGEEWLQVFRARLINGQLEHNLNTFTQAALIEALLRDADSHDKKPVQATVRINDTLTIKQFPYTLPIEAAHYHLQHSGGDVYLHTAEEQQTMHPARLDSLYDIQVQTDQAGQQTPHLKAGIPAHLSVHLRASKSHDYVSLEIPLPSGIHITQKPQVADGYTLYYPNKIVVCFQHLAIGDHVFSFDIMPVLRGQFVWPATRCSLMYYPYIFGNNQLSYLTID